MKEITIKLNKKDIKAIYKAHKYLCDIKSDLLENELGKILFQYEKIHNRNQPCIRTAAGDDCARAQDHEQWMDQTWPSN